ncbi:MAG: DEAD/DEAH box helicase [Acidobacteria bacterium]|nr:DEAD/DEAH box helicase [Acidobacteriota bacterium]
MPFATLKLHPSLSKGLKELGFARPTPVQSAAIPPAMAGRDVLASAMTGSGKTAAFLLPILHRLIDRPRGVTRALVLTPTRELALQILEHLNDLAIHTPITAAAVIGGVGMGPQEHAFRSGVDVIIATPGRLLDHLRAPYAKLGSLEHLVIDEADRMLDMGFLPEIRRVLRHLPARRQTFFFSATLPAPIIELTRELLHDAVRVHLDRPATPAVGIAQAVYPVPQSLKAALLVALLERGDVQDALVFTRTKHRANRVAEFLVRRGVKAERIHGNRSQSQRTAALSGFKGGKFQVLVATDIAARGIDVEALGHVVNFDVPKVPDDYVHRVGRTARAEAVGSAFTFVAPEEEAELQQIEKAIGKRLPRVTVPDFDYAAVPAGQLEIPRGVRIAAMRQEKAAARARAEAKKQRGAIAGRAPAARPRHAPARPGLHGTGAGGPGGRSQRWSGRRRQR